MTVFIIGPLEDSDGAVQEGPSGGQAYIREYLVKESFARKILPPEDIKEGCKVRSANLANAPIITIVSS